jgi:KipI family sensor histidine kinase inhibitor
LAIKFLPCGDTGLTVQFGEVIDRDLSRRILCLRSVVDSAGLKGVVETVPSYRSLTIHYDPLQTCQADLIESLKPLVEETDDDGNIHSTHWRFPVCFENEEFAPDLDHVADWAGMPKQAVIDILTSTPLYLYMIGFAPGQPHFGDLPESLAIPRRENPVQRIAKGSLLIATRLVVLYPVDNPTGWHVVGRCPIPIYDITSENPVLLTPGDTLSLYSVEMPEYNAIASQISAGTYDIEKASAS